MPTASWPIGATPDIFVLLLMSIVVGILPLLVVMTTSFTKISIVLVLLRNALGIQQAPSGMAISGLAMAATLLVMAPVWQQIAAQLDLVAIFDGRERPELSQLVDAGRKPLEVFMRRHVDSNELTTLDRLITDMRFLETKDADEIKEQSAPGEEPWLVLVSAFAISEISAAFKIGMFLAIGFAVIDLVVANLLMAMGMTMFPPSTVSIPLKLLIFVLSSGLSQLMHGLIASYPR